MQVERAGVNGVLDTHPGDASVIARTLETDLDPRGMVPTDQRTTHRGVHRQPVALAVGESTDAQPCTHLCMVVADRDRTPRLGYLQAFGE
jgi:hypothetical protein